MLFRPLTLALPLLAMPLSAFSMTLELPSTARSAAERNEPMASYQLPVGPYSAGTIETLRAEGRLDQRAWRIEQNAATTLQILEPLRAQLQELGFETLFECETQSCGGFDFRFETEIMPEPDMHVDLGDFRFLAASRPGSDQPEYISLVVSRSASAGFVQITHVGTEAAPAPAPVTSTKGSTAAEAPEWMEPQGVSVLDDLSFASGSSRLDQGPFNSLSALAQFLKEDPDRRVTLVGHTDATGSLQGNITLSQKRAEAVAARLILGHGVPQDQISARGVGFLSPRATNDTETGRTLNRRVEAVITSLN